MALLFVYVSFALGVSFICSTLEATLLASQNSILADQRDQGMRGSGKLLALKQGRFDDAISAILILNTLANTLGATLAGGQAARIFGAWIGVFSGILTLLILVVSEIIPKTLGAVYSRQLANAVGWTLEFLTRAMRPFLALSGLLTGLLTRGKQTSFSRGELAAVIANASREGTISSDESRMLANLLRFNDVQIQDVMTPRTVAFMMPANATVADLLSRREALGFSRIPLYRDDPDDVVGYLLQQDVLRAVAGGCDRLLSLERFARPIFFIPELATLRMALRQILDRGEHLAMVTDEHGGLAGLVSLEDLTETILGVEIVDEMDQVADLRQRAMRLRDRRLERWRKKRLLRLEVNEGDSVN